MADNHISLFPIARILTALGARPGRCKNTFHSPFREDATASLHIDPYRNIWYDFGAGTGGGNIDLVMKCLGCSAKEAADYILSLSQAEGTSSALASSGIPSKTIKPAEAGTLTSRILQVRELKSQYLLDYSGSRGIPASIATRYCMEVVLRGKNPGKTFEHIGFRNNNGGLALKAPSGFKSTTKSGITTIDTLGEFSQQPSSGTVTVFEGFFDFLSWLASKGTELPPTDVVVLNSVSNVSRTIPYLRLHRTVICCLDNDKAGRSALETIRSLRAEICDPAILDGSLFYVGYNDVNEWWMAVNHLLPEK